MSTRKSSPLPWRIDNPGDSSTIWDDEGIYVLNTWWEDAAFIVQCVNHHDALVKALESIVYVCEQRMQPPSEMYKHILLLASLAVARSQEAPNAAD